MLTNANIAYQQVCDERQFVFCRICNLDVVVHENNKAKLQKQYRTLA